MIKKLKNVILFSFVLLLAACGSQETASNSEASDSEVREIKVAVPPTSKPLSWKNENGELVGYEPDILRLVDEKLTDYSFNLVGVADSAAEIGLDTGKYDMIAQGLFKSEERAEKYLIPSQHNGASLMKIYTNEENKDIKGMKDLVGKRIVPPSPGGGVFNFITNWNEENPSHQIEFKTSDAGISYADRLKEVDAGKYDALILPSNLGQSKIIEKLNLNIHVTDPVKIFPTYFMIHNTEENKDLTEKVSNALKELKDEGKLSELSIKYYDEDVFQYE